MDEKTEKSFNMLKSYVLDDAHKMGEQMNTETEKKINSRLEERWELLSRQSEKKLAKELAAIKHQQRSMLQDAELMARKELIECRTKITDEVFALVREKIDELKHCGEYDRWLEQTLKKAIADCGGEGEVLVCSDDIGKISGAKAVEIIGGVIVKNQKNGITADYSIDTLLDEARTEFVKTSGLTIEI